MSIGTLIIGKRRDPSFAVFKVLSISRNGWMTCQLYSDQQGNLATNGFICKWRTSEMVPITQEAA